LKKTMKAIRARVGPVGLSLCAAALTAVAFAAVSVAQNGDSGKGEKGLDRAEEGTVIGPPHVFGHELSDEDRAALESFRECIEEQGVEPPERPRFDPENPPEPPSRAEIEEMRKAHEACKEKLPENMQDMPGPSIRFHGCGPGGPPPARKESGEDQGDNQSQGFVVPAPAPSGTS
jgi:hypothetical protein